MSSRAVRSSDSPRPHLGASLCQKPRPRVTSAQDSEPPLITDRGNQCSLLPVVWASCFPTSSAFLGPCVLSTAVSVPQVTHMETTDQAALRVGSQASTRTYRMDSQSPSQPHLTSRAMWPVPGMHGFKRATPELPPNLDPGLQPSSVKSVIL